MNILNHFFFSFTLLYVFFNETQSLFTIITFAIIFGVLIDLNQVIGYILKKPATHRRTWIEEPFGLILFALPIGIILSFVDKAFLPMTMLPYAGHIFLDYLGIHDVCPLAPFSKKESYVGFFTPFPKSLRYPNKGKGISEIYFLILNILVFLIAII